jgi:integrase
MCRTDLMRGTLRGSRWLPGPMSSTLSSWPATTAASTGSTRPRGEVAGLMWSDVDLGAGTITVARNRVQAGAGNVVEGDPKTLSSRRTLPLDESLVSVLRRASARYAEERLALGAAHARQRLRRGQRNRGAVHPGHTHADVAQAHHVGRRAADPLA